MALDQCQANPHSTYQRPQLPRIFMGLGEDTYIRCIPGIENRDSRMTVKILSKNFGDCLPDDLNQLIQSCAKSAVI